MKFQSMWPEAIINININIHININIVNNPIIILL